MTVEGNVSTIPVVKLANANGISVGSIGSKDEYIDGTIDLTGLDLRSSIEVLKNTKHLICTATSTFHLANMVQTDVTGIWTFNSVGKNFDKRFHRFGRIEQMDLECSPCQEKGNDYWIKNKANCGWKCREMDANLIFENVKKAMDEKKTLSNSAIIFIPQRNASKFVEKCLESVMSQDYDDLGIIFIDDASDDNTVEIAKNKLKGRKDVVFHVNESRQQLILR